MYYSPFSKIPPSNTKKEKKDSGRSQVKSPKRTALALVLVPEGAKRNRHRTTRSIDLLVRSTSPHLSLRPTRKGSLRLDATSLGATKKKRRFLFPGRLEEGLLYAEASAEDGEGNAQPRHNVVTRDLGLAPPLFLLARTATCTRTGPAGGSERPCY